MSLESLLRAVQNTANAALNRDALCDCTDARCPAHRGRTGCSAPIAQHLYRIDTADRFGMYFCDPCAMDALNSGVVGTMPAAMLALE